jgi:ribosomal protein S18 acetylase RimI-like enzyme
MGSDEGKQRNLATGGEPSEAAVLPPSSGKVAGPEPAPAAFGEPLLELDIRMGGPEDAGPAALLHAEQIADGFLSLLGTPFLTRLYRRISLLPTAFLLVAEEDGTVVGFVAGSSDVGALYKAFLIHDGMAAAVDTAGHLARNWRRVLETLRHGSQRGEGTGTSVELLAIAVSPSYQGRGVGRRLVDSFLRQVEDDDGSNACVVVAADNSAAIGLYQRAGFKAKHDFELHAGTTSLLMLWEGKLGTGPGHQGRT